MTSNTGTNELLVKAAKEILHLHLCEQEGIVSGQPTREQWLKAVDNLSEALSQCEQPEEVTHEKFFGENINRVKKALQPEVNELSDTLEWMALFYGALHELVQLKENKDREGETTDYLERKPKAWYLAKQAIHLWKESDYGANKFPKPVNEGVEKAAEESRERYVEDHYVDHKYVSDQTGIKMHIIESWAKQDFKQGFIAGAQWQSSQPKEEAGILPNLKKSTENLSKIEDKDRWLNEIRGEDAGIKTPEWILEAHFGSDYWEIPPEHIPHIVNAMREYHDQFPTIDTIRIKEHKRCIELIHERDELKKLLDECGKKLMPDVREDLNNI